MAHPTNTPVSVISTSKTWMEARALEELERVARLPGMALVVGMPDLHAGMEGPIGAACFSLGRFYPFLVGNDIGCGMGVWQTSVRAHKAKVDRWERRLTQIEGEWEGDADTFLHERGVAESEFDSALGTIGGGNHFAEMLRVDGVDLPDRFAELGLSEDHLMLLVHSGSRGLGASIMRAHVDRYRDAGLDDGSDEAADYVTRHDHAVSWASANRALIARRVAEAIAADARPVLDITHNSVTRVSLAGEVGWLHRKGAAPSDEGAVVVPGSRGSLSYILDPIGDGTINAKSLAHGAGRKWDRSSAKGRLERRFSPDDLRRTSLGSRVICEDKSLLYEEAPQAYKDIEDVIDALVRSGVARVIARLRPILTYKTSRRT